jgi:hypothetical protein
MVTQKKKKATQTRMWLKWVWRHCTLDLEQNITKHNFPPSGRRNHNGAPLCTNKHFAEHNAQCPPHMFIICAKASTCTENITGEEGQSPSHWSDRFMKSISALNQNPKPTFDSEFWDSCLMTKFQNPQKTLKWVCFLCFSESFSHHILWPPSINVFLSPW